MFYTSLKFTIKTRKQYQRRHCLLCWLENSNLKSLSANPTKWSNKLKQFVSKLPTNSLSVFDPFVWLVPKGWSLYYFLWSISCLCYVSIPSKNIRKPFSDVFRGYRNITLREIELRTSLTKVFIPILNMI